MTTRVRRGAGGLGRLGGLAVAAALMGSGCDGSDRQAGPSPWPSAPAPPAPPAPSPPAGEPALAVERRPERASFLVRSESCDGFADAARAVALQAVGPYGFGGAGYAFAESGGVAGPRATSSGRDSALSAAPAPASAAGSGAAPQAGPVFSGTNVQEAGVDEPDVVKTDGRLLVTTTDGRLRVLDVTGVPRQLGSLDLAGGAGNLLLVGNRALVLADGSRYPATGLAEDQGAASAPIRPKTKVTVVDLANPAKPRIARTHEIDGSYVDARLVGGVARLVTRSSPDISFPRTQPGNQEDVRKAQAANAHIVRNAAPASFLPKGASCTDAYVPVQASGVGTIAVQSLDPRAEAPGAAVTVVGDASTVYASSERLFVATNPGGLGGPVRLAQEPRTAPGTGRTAIHAFDITDPAKARYAGSGDVPGRLLNQFSLSEDAGVLRVATTLDATSGSGGGAGPSGGSSQSRVTVLRPAGEEWVETGAVDGLGKGERIYAVRFLGTTGYVVTFRQIDPLYVLDLRDVRKPEVTGELKITGYSAYLHPAGDRRLLGIGQEATEEGRRVGTQLSLFDVGDPAAPTKLAGAVLASATSSAEQDHHAFLYWPATGLVVAPVRSYGGGRGPIPVTAAPQERFVGAVAFRVADNSVTEAGRITHPGSTPIDRSLVVGDRLLTLSTVGIAANDLKSLEDQGFVPFR